MAGRAYGRSVVGVSAAILFPVVGTLVTGLADTFSCRAGADVAADLARGINDVGIKKLDAT